MMKEFWESKYRPERAFEALQPTASSFQPTSSTNQFVGYIDRLRQEAFEKVMANQVEGDEYERYCSKMVEWPENDDPITWWLQEKQRLEYPTLHKMAINILSIPAMSADVERLFSSAGLTLSNRRNRMGTDMLEALESLKSWLKIRDFEWDQEATGIKHSDSGSGDSSE